MYYDRQYDDALYDFTCLIFYREYFIIRKEKEEKLQ